ncbi:MAG: hypothetical protein A2036_03515 [Omnitrophica bacterium GWA2_50_21]|nr:MAG: hypothetical protein A2036_03515 [Omnitrophica bacterium GWA2_50_21]
MFVTDRDLGIVKMCLEQKFMTLFQISRMFFPESRNVWQVPMKRVRTLVKADLLKAVTLRVDAKRLYVATSRGVSLLRQKNLSGGLGALKELNDKTWEHDATVTDVRIIFEKLLEFKKWTPERVLKSANVRQKVPDGIVWNERHRFIVEVELTLKNKRYYERAFDDMCIKHYPAGNILYIAGKESDKNWLMEQASSWKRIYFATMESFEPMRYGVLLLNSYDHRIYLERHALGGSLFFDPREEDRCDPNPDDDEDVDGMLAGASEAK